MTSVVPLGRDAFVFSWPNGSYLSPFVVTTAGVVAFDPINAEAAAAYRAAIAGVTDAPVAAIVYSHDHRDHIAGASALAPDAAVMARRPVADRITARGDDDVAAPTHHLAASGTIELGDKKIDFHDFGPGHSRSNIAFVLDTDGGSTLVYVDVVEPGVAPYRELPDTDLGGLLHCLAEADALGVDRVMGGHVGPDDASWIAANRRYFDDLIVSTAAAFNELGGQTPGPGEDGIAMTERVRTTTCRLAAEALRAEYGSWRGFDEWAPRNADRVLSYLITGN